MMSVGAFQRRALSAALAVLAAGCAIARPHVKSLRDESAHSIQFDAPVTTSIRSLNSIPSHCGFAADHRVRPEEFRVYEVVGRITHIKPERDRDLHVVLQDLDDPHAYLVTESDDPNFGGNVASPYRAKLGDARRMLEDLLRASEKQEWKDLEGVVVRVTGVGFFDIAHLQHGRARSCIELHPILTIERVTRTH